MIVNIVADEIVKTEGWCSALKFFRDVAPYRVENVAVHFTLTVGEGGKSEKVHSLPIIERVVMALCALHTCAEEQAHGVGHVIERHSLVIDVISHSSVFPEHALS